MLSEVFKILVLPIGCSIAVRPLRPLIDPYLQDLTTWLLATELHLLQIPVVVGYRELTVSSGHWIVAPACGGWRFLLPGLALCWASALLWRMPWRWQPIYLVGCAVALVLTNGLRTLSIVLLNHWHIPAGREDHALFSLVIYTVLMPVLVWAGWRGAHHVPERIR